MDDTTAKKVINLEGLATMVTKIKTYVAEQLVDIKAKLVTSSISLAGTTPSITVSDYTQETYITCTDTLESLTINNDTTKDYDISIHFTTSSTFAGVTVSSTFKTIDDIDNFDFEPSSEYELSIRNNIFVIGEIQTKTIS